MTRRLACAMLSLALAVVPIAGCSDNPEDHAEEARSGDTEEAREETSEMNRDLQQGDTTELGD
jgi:ketopantoate reductase